MGLAPRPWHEFIVAIRFVILLGVCAAASCNALVWAKALRKRGLGREQRSLLHSTPTLLLTSTIWSVPGWVIFHILYGWTFGDAAPAVASIERAVALWILLPSVPIGAAAGWVWHRWANRRAVTQAPATVVHGLGYWGEFPLEFDRVIQTHLP
jgi:hypothetical protein